MRVIEARFVKFDQTVNGANNSDLISWEQIIGESEMGDNEANDDEEDSGNDLDEDCEINDVMSGDGTIENEVGDLPNIKNFQPMRAMIRH